MAKAPHLPSTDELLAPERARAQPLSRGAQLLLLFGLGMALAYAGEALQQPVLSALAAAMMGTALVAGLLYLVWKLFADAGRAVREARRAGIRQVEPARQVHGLGKLWLALYVIALMPAGLAIEAAAKQRWPESAAWGVAWLALFPAAAWLFHRYGIAHLAISAFAALCAIAAYAAFALGLAT